MDQILFDKFNDKTYSLTPLDLVLMLKMYQDDDKGGGFAFLDDKGLELIRVRVF